MQCPPGSFGAGSLGPKSPQDAPKSAPLVQASYTQRLPTQAETSVITLPGGGRVAVHGTFDHDNLWGIDVTLRLYAETKSVRSLVACVTIPTGGVRVPRALIDHSGIAEKWVLTASWGTWPTTPPGTALTGPNLKVTMATTQADSPLGLPQAIRAERFEGLPIAERVPSQWRWGQTLLGAVDFDATSVNNAEPYILHDGAAFLRQLAFTLTSATARWIHIVSSLDQTRFIHSRLCSPSGGEVQWDFTDSHHRGSARDGLYMRLRGVPGIRICTSATNPTAIDALATGFFIGEVA